MELVIRPVNDTFLERVLFPALRMAVTDAKGAVTMIDDAIVEPRLRLLLELLEERGLYGGLSALDGELWSEIIYRLLFDQWVVTERGWDVGPLKEGFAGSWDLALHLALMMENPHYPYSDPVEAEDRRQDALDMEGPMPGGLVALLCGHWDPFPEFPPHEVLSTVGRCSYRQDERRAVADWSYRGAPAVRLWNSQLPTRLSRLLKREEVRLSIDMPDQRDILDYWLGVSAKAPALSVAFSGLGDAAMGWMEGIGHLTRLIREAATTDMGLTTWVSPVRRSASTTEG
jgi:hypothetical protein